MALALQRVRGSFPFRRDGCRACGERLLLVGVQRRERRGTRERMRRVRIAVEQLDHVRRSTSTSATSPTTRGSPPRLCAANELRAHSVEPGDRSKTCYARRRRKGSRTGSDAATDKANVPRHWRSRLSVRRRGPILPTECECGFLRRYKESLIASSSACSHIALMRLPSPPPFQFNP
jgi:hypothetical protein